MAEVLKPSFELPWPDESKRKLKMETKRQEQVKAIGEKRHLPSNEPKKGGLSMIAVRASKKKKDS